MQDPQTDVNPYRSPGLPVVRVLCRECEHRSGPRCYAKTVPCPIEGSRVQERSCATVNAAFDCADFAEYQPPEPLPPPGPFTAGFVLGVLAMFIFTTAWLFR